MSDSPSAPRTFLIADIRGYTRYTEEYGDEAAAELATNFAELVADGVQAHDGQLVELRGDEALAVFASARQAIRAAVDLQARFGDEAGANSEVPLKVGMGIDSGEAVEVDDGGFRGASLNVAARLCGRAHGGDVLVSASTVRLAGRLGGLQYSDRGRVRLKGVPEPVHIYQVYSELDAPRSSNWVLMILGRPGRGFGWKLGAAVVALAAITAAAVVYLTSGDQGDVGTAAPGGGVPVTTASEVLAANAGLDAIVPAALWKDCRLQTVPEPKALQTAVCLPASGMPDRWEISSYPNGAVLKEAYDGQLRARSDIERNSGKCNAFSWGGERQWLHGPDKPGGHVFCYFDGDDAIAVWTHERLGQPTHRDVLMVAREGGSDHAGLTHWWRPWHHLIGKAQ
ncbi:MAG TPA: adenylate/guanylate cyclase domain-containing protein [Gemmatimonadaceae bacterium]|nr:adenylate/guanylate cyclase domain-containing protein [Gemmatimonadaceae bacterium]